MRCAYNTNNTEKYVAYAFGTAQGVHYMKINQSSGAIWGRWLRALSDVVWSEGCDLVDAWRMYPQLFHLDTNGERECVLTARQKVVLDKGWIVKTGYNVVVVCGWKERNSRVSSYF